MSPVKIKPDEEAGSESSGILAQSAHLPVLQSPCGSLLVSGPAGQAEQDTGLKTQWPGLFLSWRPGPNSAQIPSLCCFSGSNSQTGEKAVSAFTPANLFSQILGVSLGNPSGLDPHMCFHVPTSVSYSRSYWNCCCPPPMSYKAAAQKQLGLH